MRTALRVFGIVLLSVVASAGSRADSSVTIDGRFVLRTLRAWVGNAQSVAYDVEYEYRDGDGAQIETMVGSVLILRAILGDPTRKYHVRAVRTDAAGESTRYEFASDWRLITLVHHDAREVHQTHRLVSAAFPIKQPGAPVLGQFTHFPAFNVEIEHGRVARIGVVEQDGALLHAVTLREAGGSQFLLIDAVSGALREMRRDSNTPDGRRVASWRLSNVRFDLDTPASVFRPTTPRGYTYVRAEPAPYEGGEPRAGALAPDLDFVDLHGREVRVSSFKGKAVYFYWWTKSVDAEYNRLHALERLHRAFADDEDVVIVCVLRSLDGELELSEEAALDNGFTFPVLVDVEEHWSGFGTNSPHNQLLIAPNGSPVHVPGLPGAMHFVERNIRLHVEAHRAWMRDVPF